MEIRDLIVTPIVIFLIFGAAYFLRPYFTDTLTRRYFIPALAVRIAGALALGLIYQFYYDGGDTYNFHTHGSRHLWEAFWDDPEKGIRLFLKDENQQGLYRYTSKIPFYKDNSSMSVIRLAAVFDLFTFSSYSATAVFFAVFSFVGMWMFFITFYKRYPTMHKSLALAALFIPSVVFWGSGLLKDTITLGCLGIATYLVDALFIRFRFSVLKLLLLVISFYCLFVIKLYILLAFIPATILWVFLENFVKIRNVLLRLILFPVVLLLSGALCYLSLEQAGESNPRYSLEALSKTAQITAYDIRFYTGREAGSGYYLGELDGSWSSMLNLAPQAINVSLFRPYLWEVKNPLMLLSSVESLILFVFGLYVLVVAIRAARRPAFDPTVLFCLLFAITFAFAVGVSTYNFGTLTRYKIPLLPFFVIGLLVILHYAKRERKLEVLDKTE